MPTKTATIKEGWQKLKLGEVCDFKYGFTASAKKENTGVKLVRITDIVPDLIDWKSVPFCEIKKDKLEQFIIKKGDVLVARTGATVGYAKLIRKEPPIKSVFASYLIKISPNNDILNPFFLGTIIESNMFKDFITTNAGGSAQPHANAPVLKTFEIDLPPLPMQKKIAEVLGVYDDLIEVNQKKIKILEDMAQTIYKEWFVKPVKDGLPDGWEVKKIVDVYSVKYGKTLPKTLITDNGKYPVYGAGGIIGFFENANCFERTTLITSRGNGSGTVWRTQGEGFITNNSFTINPLEEYSYFSFSFIFLSLLNANIKSAVSGSAQPQVTIESLNYVEVLVSEKEIVIKFQNIVDSFYNQIDNLLLINKNLQKTRDLLIPQLVGGRVSLK